MKNHEAIQFWREKIAELEKAEALVNSPGAKFEIRKQIEEAEARISELTLGRKDVAEATWEVLDLDLLDGFFQECARHDTEFFAEHARGDKGSISRFLVNSGLASGTLGDIPLLTDEGLLLCARRDFIPRGRLHVHVVLEWKLPTGVRPETLFGSILLLRKELIDRLAPLWSRSVGNPNLRDDFGGETTVHEYPQVAIVEALTNFLIHRDYVEDDYGRINVYPESVEFVNPGISTIPPEELLSAKEPLEPKYLRNSRLIEATSMARLNQRKGSGIQRIRDALVENGSVGPDGGPGIELENDEGKKRFLLRLYRRDLTQFLIEIQRGDGLQGPKRKPSLVASASLRVAPSRLPQGTDHLFGREEELAALEAAWKDPAVHVVSLVAWGGIGKSALVSRWQMDLAARDFDGARYFDWSFYSQHTKEQGTASGDLFVAAALQHFGDTEMAGSPASPWEKGSRLAALVAEDKTLLILDGLEPLQHPPGPLAGQLKDPAVTALMRGLAAKNRGLCVVTTRVRIEDLVSFQKTTAPEWSLEQLSATAGAALLGHLGVRGRAEELEQLVDDVKGHALTLNLLGRYLAEAHEGDVRRRDLVDFREVNEEIQGGHAFRVIAAYEKWIESEGDSGRRALAILRVLGLFDRPASPGSLAALRRSPPLKNLTEPLIDLSAAQWNLAVSRLRKSGLLSTSSLSSRAGTSDQTGPQTLDAHPLLREYFAEQLRTRSPATWKAAHGRLFDHLCQITEPQPDTLSGLQPLYQAVAHGCLAGRQQETCIDVYLNRILRKTDNDGFYSIRTLGALGADLGAVACFFEKPWSLVSSALTEAYQAWLLNEAAFRLRALGRLTEALEPMRAGLKNYVDQENWPNSARVAGNLSELGLTLGQISAAVADAHQAVAFADRSRDAFQRLGKRTTLADAQHQAGQWGEALALFREAEARQGRLQPDFPLLYSLWGFRYCDLLLAPAEVAAWKENPVEERSAARGDLVTACRAVWQRAEQTLKESKNSADTPLLDIALDHLSFGRATFLQVILEGSEPTAAQAHLEQAVEGLRRAGVQDMLCKGLLPLAWLRFVLADPAAARADLDEAQEIAARGPMPLLLADIHLHRARLFHDRDALAEARRLIDKHGYGRRVEELEDAEESAMGWGGGVGGGSAG